MAEAEPMRLRRKPVHEMEPQIPRAHAVPARAEAQRPLEPAARRMPTPRLTRSTISYERGHLDVDIRQQGLEIGVTNGPTIGGVQRAVSILPPYARISTSAIGDFGCGGARYDEFFVGPVVIRNGTGSGADISYDSAIVMRASASSDRFVVAPLQNAQLTFNGGVPLGVDVEAVHEFTIPAARGPLVNGAGQEVRVLAPFVEMASGDPARGFAAGGASSDMLYVGRVQVGSTVYDRAVVMHESPESDRYRVIPLPR